MKDIDFYPCTRKLCEFYCKWTKREKIIIPFINFTMCRCCLYFKPVNNYIEKKKDNNEEEEI